MKLSAGPSSSRVMSVKEILETSPESGSGGKLGVCLF
jgi:hypothetical protein